MKRKLCLIEAINNDSIDFEKRLRENIFISEDNNIMYKKTIWYTSLINAEKSCIKDDKIKKVHYKFEDHREMVEEYNVETQVLLRRAWKIKGKLGGEGKWEVEIGDPIPNVVPNIDIVDLVESQDQPILTRRNTRVNLEWRIRNLPYPLNVYTIVANENYKCIIVSTSNKKYYKKLKIPELARLHLPIEQGNIQASHSFNTLIIMYKKPQQLLDMEKEWFEELKKVKPIKDLPNDCKTQ